MARSPKGWSDADALAVPGKRLRAISEVAERCQTAFAIEPHGSFSLTPDGPEAIMVLSASLWLGINYDTTNIHRATKHRDGCRSVIMAASGRILQTSIAAPDQQPLGALMQENRSRW